MIYLYIIKKIGPKLVLIKKVINTRQNNEMNIKKLLLIEYKSQKILLRKYFNVEKCFPGKKKSKGIIKLKKYFYNNINNNLNALNIFSLTEYLNFS